ncbi:cyclin-J-like [Teleopsis dalmanni]|uniref:cyclin-J-like n=1 Tax=Teleopsis dalmanni TaxID=139649 RepID=UPI0018CFC85D|nr:cyclin-J-like [Teleopsis dalmanni]XP_037940626.1 cyclin-J-like [Teleopsis dalmanni]
MWRQVNFQDETMFDPNMCAQKEECHNPYNNDILKRLFYLENDITKIKIKDKHHEDIRVHLVFLIKSACNLLNLAKTTLHLAIYHMDIFRSCHIFLSQVNLKLVAISAICIAGKFEETDITIPSLAQMNKIFETSYTLSEYKEFEKRMLLSLSFKLNYPTTASFIEYIGAPVVTLNDFSLYVQNSQNAVFKRNSTLIFKSFSDMFNVVNNMVATISDLSLNIHDIQFINAKPSIKASACLACARIVTHVEPAWPRHLMQRTGCGFEKIQECVGMLKCCYDRSGYKYNHVNASSQQFAISPDSGISLEHYNNQKEYDSESSTNDSIDGQYIETEESIIRSPKSKRARMD